MLSDSKRQYNGIILMTGYLQRLFVVETIYYKLEEAVDSSKIDNVKKLIDQAYTVIPEFEKTLKLTSNQSEILKDITIQIEKMMETYFKPLPLSFNQKLAIVGSSLYAEQHVNEGIIRLGKLFNVEINRDFSMRKTFYEDRTKMIDYLVDKLHNHIQPNEQYMKPIEPWFNNVQSNQHFILEDIKKIGEMIGF